MTQEKTPCGQDHIAALIRVLPKHILQITATNSRKIYWHIRPTILADFLRQSAELRDCKAFVGLRADVTDSHFTITVCSYALQYLCRLDLQEKKEDIGRYKFVPSAKLPTLQASIPHDTFKAMLCEVYGVPITYPLAMVRSLAEHLTISKTGMDYSTIRRIKSAHKEARLST